VSEIIASVTDYLKTNPQIKAFTIIGLVVLLALVSFRFGQGLGRLIYYIFG
jgi:hypothetical protein